MTTLKNEKKPELLAPAGTLLSLVAGVENGADAVYMGAAKFNARAYAGNFSEEELEIGIALTHAFGKKIFITLNTLFKDDELGDVVTLFDELYRMGVDAVIIQDVGFLNLLQNRQTGAGFSPIQIHASTQMTVHNSYHAQFLKEKGVCRIVPARENTIPELKALKETGVEIETFIHGALCICYSGQCLFSGVVGGRSGNRGQCAQPCRKKYTLTVDGKPVQTDGKYLISPRDLNASDDLFRLMDAGVDSFKIEGRMKKPEYVAGVVSVYRKLIDRYAAANNGKSEKVRSVGPTTEEKEILKKLFNRDFTSGYFVKNPKNELMSRKLPYNKGIMVGKITDVDPGRGQISVHLTASLSSQDGISIGDISKETDGVEDPRQGFVVKKMYVSRKMVNEATSGETANILAPVLFEDENGKYLPKIGDAVYKTLDFNLRREIQKTLPEMPEEDVRKHIGNMDLKNKTGAQKAEAIAELIEMLAPAVPVQIPVRLKCFVCSGFLLEVTAMDEDGNEVKIESDYMVQPAIKNPFSKESAVDMLSKLGNTIYDVLSADADVIDDCFVPVGVFKETRNRALRALAAARIQSAQPKTDNPILVIPTNAELPLQNEKKSPLALCVCAYTKEDVLSALSAGADRVYVGGDIFADPFTKKECGVTISDLKEMISGSDIDPTDLEKLWWKTPFVTKESDFDEFRQTLSELSDLGISGVLASNPGVYYFVQTRFNGKFRVAADAAFNIFNSETADLFLGGGAEFVTLSPELSIRDISVLSDRLFEKRRIPGGLECAVHGRQRLMTTEHPLLETLADGKIKETARTQNKSDSIFRYALKDAKDFVFPVLTDSKGRSIIFNSKELNAYDLLPKLKNAGVSSFRIDGLGHTASELADLTARYKKELERLQTGGQKEIGTDNETESEKEESTDGSDFTRGNFMRGVY
ncbi:hypothetical protein MsAg5_01690 [Methanosarcinaceae archaeon Ag5]|uniref:Peptidase U32 collagenase domain-containing protein n=1 Tax=Methanolapillus africanus TaxID=3028297 RepID=A0AAE4MHM4_9EURY|nr:hypothetical protein [Methanosarcinaceae archaeon Ag5]